MGGKWDFKAGTVGDIKYAILSKGLDTIHQEPFSACPGLMQGMIQMGLEAATSGSTYSLYAKQATIHQA